MVEERDWVYVYDTNTYLRKKFSKQCFGPYVAITAKDNVTYHLVKLD